MNFSMSAIVVALLALAGYFLMRRIWLRQRQDQGTSYDAVKKLIASREQSPEGILRQMEVRLYDFDREVQARVQNTLTSLDLLVTEARTEAERLESLLQQVHAPADAAAPLTTAQTQLVPQLRQLGLSDRQIAAALAVSVAQVAGISRLTPSDERHAA